MEAFFDFIYRSTDAELLSFLLLLISLADVLFSCLWRIEKKCKLFSERLWKGFTVKGIASALPYASTFVITAHSKFYALIILSWSFIFGVANVFSLMANYRLYSKESYDFIINNAPHFLKGEIKNKLKIQDQERLNPSIRKEN